jgi:hypothetical protein
MDIRMLDILILIGLPAIFASFASRLARLQVSRPLVLFAFSAAALYALYGAAFYLAAPTVISMDLFVPEDTVQFSDGSTEPLGNSMLPLVKAYLRPIALFSAAAVPTLWLAIRMARTTSSQA